MKNRKLGIIGGSGIYDIQGLENIKWKKSNRPGAIPLTVFYQQV